MPHVPQLLGSLVSSTQPAPGQQVCDVVQNDVVPWHRQPVAPFIDVQVSLAPQVLPHAPQLAGCVPSTHASVVLPQQRPPAVALQSVLVAPQVHWPFEHVSLAAQTLPQPPQLCGSFMKSLQPGSAPVQHA